MSVIRKIPYIESVIGALSEEELATLQTIINTGSAGTPASISNLPSGIVAVHFTMPSGRVKDGILVKKSCLIGYDGTQRITAYKIADGLISESYEYCDINELRRIVFDVGNAGGFVNPMTTAGDIIIGGTDGEATRLAKGSDNQVLKIDPTTHLPVWGTDAGLEFVELTNITGTLSDSDYAKVSADNCIIKVSTQYYYKAFDASTLIIYQAFSRQGGTGVALFDYIEITKSTKEYSILASDIVRANPTLVGGESELTALGSGNASYRIGDTLSYLTTAPVADNTSGRLQIVVLSSEPATKYDGYLYIITEV